MISSVSAVNFRGTAASAADVINRQGAYSKQPEAAPQAETPKKKGKFWKGLAKLVVAALVVGGALLGAYKAGWTKVLPEAEKATAGFGKKVSNFLAKGGEWLDDKVWSRIFKKAAEEVAENGSKIEEVVAEAVN